ncbi:hypothetical protein GF386_01755 [Candidatus Pacearchaeota archaeon]|nr:hypothetical protein [Candidatus Pacearchaeota archaeon]MBD3282905.1 hypothetical protein [Candidatus Pacearchaeota archaeon]
MKRGSLRLIFLTLALFLIISSLVFPVLAQQNQPAQDNPVRDNVWDPIKDWFLFWQEGEISTGVAKWVLFFILILVIHAISSTIPGLDKMFEPDNEWMGWAFSVLVAFLALAYITPDEIYAIMISYSALGFTLGILIPFIILLGWTITMSIRTKHRVANRILAWVIWTVWTLFVIYKIIDSITGGELGSQTAVVGLIIIGAISIVMQLGGLHWIFRRAGKIARTAAIEAFKEKREAASAAENAEAKAVEEAGE